MTDTVNNQILAAVFTLIGKVEGLEGAVGALREDIAVLETHERRLTVIEQWPRLTEPQRMRLAALADRRARAESVHTDAVAGIPREVVTGLVYFAMTVFAFAMLHFVFHIG